MKIMTATPSDPPASGLAAALAKDAILVVVRQADAAHGRSSAVARRCDGVRDRERRVDQRHARWGVAEARCGRVGRVGLVGRD